jgi:putative Mg2+ transporter-C (MgtC) family protein
VDVIWSELLGGIGNTTQLLRVVVRLVIAAVLGGMLGWERQYEGKSAGVRTHMLVALGSALFTLVPLEAGLDASNVGRVIQGIAAGIGFLGAGTILKLSDVHEIKGLTSAACIWMTAAMGVAVGAGRIGIALIGTGLTLLILYVLGHVERWLSREVRQREGSENQNPPDVGTGETSL